ncbi:MAG: dihydrodipicolinate synthase family protein [Verrucomicrobiota bacterium]
MNPQTTTLATPASLNEGRQTPWLRGIVPPMITPLRDSDALDVAGLERLIEHIIAGGVQGLFILGTSGEGPSLSYRLRRELIDRVCRQVNHRVPVLVGITDTALVEARQIAHHAADAGADALVSSAPYYFAAGQPELVSFVEHLVDGLPLPLFLYNMPQMTKVQFTQETLRRVSYLERIVGLKDSSGDLNYFDQLLALKRERPDWSVFVGPEHLMAETVRRGGDGGVNGGAVFRPRLYFDLFKAVERQDTARAAALQAELLNLGRIFNVGHHASAVVKAMKCACSLLGLCDDFMAEPFERFAPPERAKVREILESAGVLRLTL